MTGNTSEHYRSCVLLWCNPDTLVTQNEVILSGQSTVLHTATLPAYTRNKLGVGASLGHPHLTNWLQIGGFS